MEYPILIIKKSDPMIYIYKDYDSMRKTSEELFEENIWKDAEIYDANSQKYYVIDEKKVGLRGLWGWNPLLKGKSIWVDFTFSDGITFDLEKLKEELILKIKKKKQYWEASWDIEELIEKVKTESNFKKIILFFL
jgi:hypothetical protein